MRMPLHIAKKKGVKDEKDQKENLSETLQKEA